LITKDQPMTLVLYQIVYTGNSDVVMDEAGVR